MPATPKLANDAARPIQSGDSADFVAAVQDLATRRRFTRREKGLVIRPHQVLLRNFLLPAFVCLTEGLADGNGQARATTTVYVGKHFEVRDHDQPVKYVFNGETRVARITGSLSTTARVQRLRLRAGWNLCSILVDGAPLPAIPALEAVFRWNPEARDYARLAPGETIKSGTVLWLKSESDLVLSLLGNYEERASATPVPAGGRFVAGPGLEVWVLQLPPGVTVWKFDSTTRRWQSGFAGDLASVSDLPLTLAPGDAIYVHADDRAELTTPDPALRIAYYHQDHVGSSSAITDAEGALVEERAFYPFGGTRHEERLQRIETHYQFTQKERDAETGLDYFGARYFTAVPGRFISVDPRLSKHRFKDAGSAAEFLKNPQRLNHYAYAVNNSLRFIDPDGEDIARPQRESPAPPEPKTGVTLELTGIERGPTKMVIPIESFTQSPFRQQPTRESSSRDPDLPRPPAFELSKLMDKSSAVLMQMAAQGIRIKEATIIVTRPGEKPGEEPRQTRIKLTDVFISSYHLGSSSRSGQPAMEFFSIDAAKIEIKHSPVEEPAPAPRPK
ncbi:MAG: type VI secretion system tube protein Hcp [Verrucomicrobia bacterium]|nr:type VI secretion system tube protein Hcp [Verrucomicrobiota bacterium]